MKNIKIILASLLLVVLLSGCVAYAKTIPTNQERLITFNNNLIDRYQNQFKELDAQQNILELEIKEILANKEYLGKSADMARMTIEVLKGQPVSADFTQPKN